MRTYYHTYPMAKPNYDDNKYGGFGGSDYWEDMKEYNNNVYYYEQKKKREQEEKKKAEEVYTNNYTKELPPTQPTHYTKTTFVAKWIDNNGNRCGRKVVAYSDDIKSELDLFVRQLKSSLSCEIDITVLEEDYYGR